MPEKELIKEAVKEALQEEIKPFFVDREVHYQHHQFIAEMIKWSEQIRGTICGTFARMIAIAIIGLLVLGFILWGKKTF